jgi:hypothetical protein
LKFVCNLQIGWQSPYISILRNLTMNVSKVVLVMVCLAPASLGFRLGVGKSKADDSRPAPDTKKIAEEIREALADPIVQDEARRIAADIGAIFADEGFQKQLKQVAEELEKAAEIAQETLKNQNASSRESEGPLSDKEPESLAEHMKAMFNSPEFLKETKRLHKLLQAEMAESEFVEDIGQVMQYLGKEAVKSYSFLETGAEVSGEETWAPLAGRGLGTKHRSPLTAGVARRGAPVMSLTGSDDASVADAQLLREEAVQQNAIDIPQNVSASDPVWDLFTENFKPEDLAFGLAMLAAMQPEPVLAKGGEFGIFEGRIVSLAHPAVMSLMYGASAFSAFSGYQWRRLRTIGDDIKEVKAQIKPLQAKLDALIKAATPEEGDAPADTPEMVSLKGQISPLNARVDEYTAERKELQSKDLRSSHYQMGSLILGLGTAFAIEGPVNTFLRAQKLFPGPHLYAGAGVVVSWAMAASMVPSMGKGKDWAREAHIAFNVLALGLFTWQLPTGWEIAQKVVKFTKFP